MSRTGWLVNGTLGAGILVTALALLAISQLEIDGDIYGLLGDDDPEIEKFEALSHTIPGLEELLVVCEAGMPLDQDAVADIVATPGIDAHTRTYYAPGKSVVQGFAMSVDAADWRETRPVIERIDRILGTSASTCGLTGTPAVVQEMQTRLNNDLLRALVVATILVTILFAFVYRIGLLAALMLLPVAAGIAWGLAAYALLRNELTLLAATVPTLLIGVGIDHCIHLIQSCRYSIGKDGRSRAGAVWSSWRRLVGPITLASLTTAVTFLAMTAAGLKGLVDLGWAGTFVTLGVYVASVSLLPAILLLVPERWLSESAAFDRLMQAFPPWIAKRGGLVLGFFLVIGAASVVGLFRLQPMSDNRLLESGDLPSLVLQERVAREHGLSSSPILLGFDNDDDAIELLAETDRPSDIGSLVAVPEVRGVVQVHPRDNPFVRGNYKAVVAELDRWISALGLGTYKLSGAPALNERVNQFVYTDVRLVLPLAALGIFVVLAIGMRSILRPCLALLPLSLALLTLIGVMGLLGIAASVVTVAITPLVLGIGVDGGVHLLAAWDRHEGRLVDVFTETGLAIVVTVCTSIAAFAAFIVSKSPSLVHFGSQASFALAGCLVVTLVILPWLLRRLLVQDIR